MPVRRTWTIWRAIVARLDRGVSEEENVLLDKQLHYTIARASGNMLFVDILNALSDVMDLFIADLRIDIMSETHRKEALFATHRRIVEAIVNKDLPSGFEAIDEHFCADRSAAPYAQPGNSVKAASAAPNSANKKAPGSEAHGLGTWCRIIEL